MFSGIVSRLDLPYNQPDALWERPRTTGVPMKPLALRLIGGNTTAIFVVTALVLMGIFLLVFNKTTFFSGMKLDEVTSTLSRSK